MTVCDNPWYARATADGRGVGLEGQVRDDLAGQLGAALRMSIYT